MPNRLPDCKDLSIELFPPLKPGFKDLMKVRNPLAIRSEIENRLKNQPGFEKIGVAMSLVFVAHNGLEPRKEGKPAVIHPLRVAWRLMQYRQITTGKLPSPIDLYGALLHDVLEDSVTVSANDIRRKLGNQGEEVLRGIRILTKKYKHGRVKPKETEEYYTGIWNSPDNIQELKVLDAIDNMESLYPNAKMDAEFIKTQAVEKYRYVLPLAKRFPSLCQELTEALRPHEHLLFSRRQKRKIA